MNRYSITVRLADVGDAKKSWEARVEVEREDGEIVEIGVECEVGKAAADIASDVTLIDTVRVVGRFDLVGFDEKRADEEVLS